MNIVKFLIMSHKCNYTKKKKLKSANELKLIIT